MCRLDHLFLCKIFQSRCLSITIHTTFKHTNKKLWLNSRVACVVQYCIEILLFCRIHLKQSLPRLTLYDWRSPTSPCWGRFSTASSSQLSTSSRAFEGSWELRAAFSGTRLTWPRGLPGSTGTTWASPWQGAPSLGEEGACQVRSNFESKTIFLHHINKTLHYDCFSDHNNSSQRSVMFISNI